MMMTENQYTNSFFHASWRVHPKDCLKGRGGYYLGICGAEGSGGEVEIVNILLSEITITISILIITFT